MYLGILLHVMSKLFFVMGSYAMHFALGRFLPEAEYGLIGIIITIINFEYIFFTDGVRQGIAKSIAEKVYDEKHIIKTGFKFQAALIVIFFLITFGGAGFIADLLGDSGMTFYIQGIALLLPFTGIYSLILGILNGHKNFRAEAGISAVYPFLKLTIIPFALWVFPDAVLGAEAGFLTAGVLTMLLSVGVLLHFNKKHVFYKSDRKAPFGEYVRLTSSYMLLFCVSTVMMNLDTLILKGVSGDDTIVGYYTGVATFAKVPYFLLTAFYTVALPIITRHYAAGKVREAAAEIGNMFLTILALILPMVTTLSAASGDVLSMFYKASYRAGGCALSILVYGIAFLGMTLFFTMVLSAADRKRFIMVLSLVMLLGQALLCPLLTSLLSLNGTATATFIVAGLGMLASALYTVRIFGSFWNRRHTVLILANGALFVGFYMLLHHFRIESFFLLALICGSYYLISAGMGMACSGLLQKLVCRLWEKS